MEDGTGVSEIYNIYSFNIILDKDKKPVLNKTLDMLKEEFGDDLRIRDLEYIEIKSKSNTNKLFIF